MCVCICVAYRCVGVVCCVNEPSIGFCFCTEHLLHLLHFAAFAVFAERCRPFDYFCVCVVCGHLLYATLYFDLAFGMAFGIVSIDSISISD